MDSAREKAIRDIHSSTLQVWDYPANGDEINIKFAVPNCSECRVEWPCMTITVLDDPSTYIELDKDNKPTGPYVPNPDCDKCDDSACIEHYMAAGGYND